MGNCARIGRGTRDITRKAVTGLGKLSFGTWGEGRAGVREVLARASGRCEGQA